jgi:hypothetical protein
MINKKQKFIHGDCLEEMDKLILQGVIISDIPQVEWDIIKKDLKKYFIYE